MSKAEMRWPHLRPEAVSWIGGCDGDVNLLKDNKTSFGLAWMALYYDKPMPKVAPFVQEMVSLAVTLAWL